MQPGIALRPAAKLSRSAPSMGARRSTSRSTRRLAFPSRRSICRPALEIEASEQRYVDKPTPGARLRNCRGLWGEYADQVVQLRGDSATFDWSLHLGRAGLVFVDCSHAYDYARTDSESAMRLVKTGGIVLWHGYGVWPSVTQALDELEAARRPGLVNIRGCSLVFWRAG